MNNTEQNFTQKPNETWMYDIIAEIQLQCQKF